MLARRQSPPVVAIWRSTWLPGSETFIRNQMLAMTRWTPVAIGAARTESAVSEVGDRVVFGAGRTGQLRRRLFWYTFRSSAVTRAISSSGAKVVHAHFAYDGFRVLPAARKLRIPLVVTLHGVDVTAHACRPGLKGWAYRRNLKKLFEHADQLVAVSEFIRDQAIRYGAEPGRVKVVHIGLPERSDAKHSSSSARATDIAFVGRLVEKKGVDDLLRAIHSIGDAVTLRIAGDGPLRAELEELAKSLNVTAYFLGHIGPREVSELLDSALMFAAPSHVSAAGDTEGLPTVVMEAGKHGLPVVGYRHSGIPEVVTESTGILVEERDVAGLAAAIQELRTDDARRRRLGENARLRIANEFSIDRCTNNLEEIYDRVAVVETD